jgi:MHS family proline/betaine transporter-like MFS transporter
MVLIVLFAINMAMPNGAAPVAFTDMMTAHLRYTGVAVTMNLSVALFGGTVPLIATWLIATTGNQTAPAWYLIAVSIVSFLTILTIRPTTLSRGR